GLHGTPVLYYGDELGLRQVEIPDDRVLDVNDRDGARTPMPWGDVEWQDPWLPEGGGVPSVAAQRDDPSSGLGFCRELVGLRRSRPELRHGGYEQLDASDGVWAWRRGAETVVAVNLGAEPVDLGVDGEVIFSTAGRQSRRLEPWEGVIVS